MIRDFSYVLEAIRDAFAAIKTKREQGDRDFFMVSHGQPDWGDLMSTQAQINQIVAVANATTAYQGDIAPGT